MLARGDPIEGRVSAEEAKALLGTTMSFYMTAELYNDYVYPFNNDTTQFNYKKYCQTMKINID